MVAQLIQLRVHARRNRAAIDQRQRRLGDERRRDPRGHIVERVQPMRRDRATAAPASPPARVFSPGSLLRLAASARTSRGPAESRRKPRQQPLQIQNPAEAPPHLLRASAGPHAPRPPPHSALQSAGIEQRPQNRCAQQPLAHRRLARIESVKQRGATRPDPETAARPVPDCAPSPGPAPAPSSAPRTSAESMCSASFFCVVRT